jgi:replicative superfamily II helicase
MRTNVVIDDTLMNTAKKISGLKTKKETIEEALKLLIAQGKQAQIRTLMNMAFVRTVRINKVFTRYRENYPDNFCNNVKIDQGRKREKRAVGDADVFKIPLREPTRELR